MADRGGAVHRQTEPGLRALWRLRPADAARRMVRPRMGLFARLLDLGRVKQRGDDRRRADPDRHPGLDQFGAPSVVGVVGGLVFVVAHRGLSMASAASWEAGR